MWLLAYVLVGAGIGLFPWVMLGWRNLDHEDVPYIIGTVSLCCTVTTVFYFWVRATS